MPPRQRKHIPKYEKAYRFFAKAERAQRVFTTLDIQRTTSYTPGVIYSYYAKKWKWFLKEHPGGGWYCKGLFTHSYDEFVDLHKQSYAPQKPPIEIIKEPSIPSIVLDNWAWMMLLVLVLIKLRNSTRRGLRYRLIR